MGAAGMGQWIEMAQKGTAAWMNFYETAKAAQQDNKNITANYAAVDADILRQQNETNTQSNEQKGDRAMQADRDLAMLRVVNGERGASANTASRFAGQTGYFEGLDIHRIEANRKSQIAGLQSSKEANQAAAEQKERGNQGVWENALLGAINGTTSAAVQISAQDYRDQRLQYAMGGGRGQFKYDPWYNHSPFGGSGSGGSMGYDASNDVTIDTGPPGGETTFS